MISPSVVSTDRLPAPSPEAIAELTRPDRRVLVLGEHLGRLRGLAEGLLRVGCRVEIAVLGGVSLGIIDHHLTVIDSIQLGRASADAVHAARTDALMPPIAVMLADGPRHRFAGTHYVVGQVDENGDLVDIPQVVRVDAGWPLSPNDSRRAASASTPRRRLSVPLKALSNLAKLDELLGRTLRPIRGKFGGAPSLVPIQEIQSPLPF